MASASIPVDDVFRLAKTFLLARSAFNRAYCKSWYGEVQPSSDEVGWKLLEQLRLIITRYYFAFRRHERGIEQASRELFRLELVGQADYSFEDAVGFVKWYGVLKGKIDESIAHLYEFHGDSFGDLVDAYPLAGQELVQRALASREHGSASRRQGFLDEAELRDALREKLGVPWYRLICRGANYVMHALEMACYQSFLYRVLTGRDERVTWTADEQTAVDFAGRYAD
jgi:hypothetical protein